MQADSTQLLSTQADLFCHGTTPVTRKNPKTDRQLIHGVLLGERGCSNEWFPNAFCFIWIDDAGQGAC